MSEFRIKPFDFEAVVARAGLRLDGTPRAGGPEAVTGANFRTAMTEALQNVSQAQKESSTLAREFVLGNPTVSLESTMIAASKANLGFQAVVQVRNRLAQAYSDVMNMQV